MEIIIKPITKSASDKILDFCLENGCTEFTFNYLCSNELEKRKADEFLKKFSIFKQNNQYIFNEKSLKQLKILCPRGIMPNIKEIELGFEDLTLFKDKEKILEIVSHEYMGFLDLNDTELEQFKKLGIPFEGKEENF